MEKPFMSNNEFQLMKLIVENPKLLSNFQWASEHKRWVELIFALVTRMSNKPENEVRLTIEKLDVLGLLDVEMLAEVNDLGGDLNEIRILKLLSESGFGEEESKNYLLVMQEAAQGLKKNHDGKIQKYMRVYGQKMIDEVNQNFTFSNMNDKDVEYAFTYWLQNVLNMPVNLKADSMDIFCKKMQITHENLLEGADKLDLNLALLNDIINQYIIDQEENHEQSTL